METGLHREMTDLSEIGNVGNILSCVQKAGKLSEVNGQATLSLGRVPIGQIAQWDSLGG